MEVDTDCTFQFGAELADIYGAWEPMEIINLEDNDTTFYDVGSGHIGFVLYDQYADAFEFRPDSTAALYYVGLGRFCADRVDATWTLKQDTIYISRFSTGADKLPLIELTPSKMTVIDMINFKLSKATYSKVN
jgi:hypothetical protein